MTGRRRRDRPLTEEDAALWAHVIQHVQPLAKPAKRQRRKPAAVAPAPPSPSPSPEATPVPAKTRKPAAGPAKRPPAAPPLTPLAPLDRQERRRLARGTRAIDGRIDLHGLRQGEAHSTLRGFLAMAQARGDKLVLIITGKGDPDSERGVLRRLVPHWLEMADLRGIVIGFEAAHRGHGGEGALYVRLRRGGK